MQTLADRADSLISSRSPLNRIPGTAKNVPFLILDNLLDRKQVLCAVISNNADDNQERLDDKFKQGGVIRWRQLPSYFYINEGWLIPYQAFIEASRVDGNTLQNRMRYAFRRRDELTRLSNLLDRDFDFYIRVWREPTALRPVEGEEYVARHPGAIGMSPNWSAPDGYGWVR
jgi:hypothetical protein